MGYSGERFDPQCILFRSAKLQLNIYIVILLFRIRTELKGGAWCPRRPIADGVYEYLEVDLQRLVVITLVETQGRFGNGQVCPELYVTFVCYSRTEFHVSESLGNTFSALKTDYIFRV